MLPTMQRRKKSHVTPSQARSELARRKLAQRDLFEFCQYVDPHFQRYAHQVYTAEKLMWVKRFIESRGQEGIGRLMIMMPPQHGKSELASIKFPAWLLGAMPDVRAILTSYGADLASRNSRSMRDLVNSNRYQAVFGVKSSAEEPVMLSSDSRSSTSWDLAQPHRGGVLAAGVGGAITGFGADLLVIDDPFKNREEAESETRRNLVDDWYKSSALTRLSPWGAVILFHTRWHQDDQAGRLIKRMATEEGADKFEIVCLPALAYETYPDEGKQKTLMADGVYEPLADPLGRAPGEALLPEKYPVEWLENKRVNIGSYDFEAMYQQSPYLREGGLFVREWFEVVEAGPGRNAAARLRYWDKAATEGGGDFSAGVLWSIDKEGFYYIEDVARGQWGPGKRDRMIVKIGKADYEQYGSFPIWHQQDPASAGLDSAQATNATLAQAGLTGRFEPLSGEKVIRAGPFSAMAEARKIRLVRGAWNEPFLSEAAAFPKGRFDDQVDAGSSGFNKIRKRQSQIFV